MVRKILAFILFTMFAGCYFYRTDSGKKRYNLNLYRMKLAKNDSVYKIIDTAKIYELKSVYSLTNNNYFNPFRKSYLKFYKGNKVAKFFYFNDIKSLNPINAEMGYYNYSNNVLITQIFFENAQSAGYIKDKNEVTIKGKDLVLFKCNEYIYEYNTIEIPKEFLIYKPDW